MINYRRAQAKLDATRSRSQRTIEHPNVHAVLLELKTGTIVIHVDTPEKTGDVEAWVPAGMLVPQGRSAHPEIRVEWSPRPTVLGIRGGSRAELCGVTEPGTVGWSFLLNEIPVCLTANHIFSLNVEHPDYTRKGCLKSSGSAVQVELLAATAFKPPPRMNSWDLAIGRYAAVADIEAAMEPCEGGTRRPYPRELADDLRPEDRCWTVGQKAPVCSSGKLEYLGYVELSFGNNTRYFFKSVLGFKADFATKGDSGGIVVYESDNTVAGLLFARVDPAPGAEGVVYANPLFLAGWKPDGVYRSPGGDIPKLRGNLLPPDL